MTIVYIANIRLPTEKAHGVQIMKMCEALAALGHTVTLLVPKRQNDIPMDPFVYYGIKPLFQIVRLTCFDRVRFWGRVGFIIQALSFAFVAERFVSRNKVDLLYTRDPEIVAMLTTHNRFVAWEVHTAAKGLFVHAALRKAKKIIAISGGLKNFLQEHGVPPARILVAHDAVDTEEFKTTQSKAETRAGLSLPQDKKIIEYVGKFHTMGHSKGVEELICMAGEVAHTHPNFLLLIVGVEPQDVSKAEEVAASAGLQSGQYCFVGHVPRTRVPEYLHAADLLLMNYPNTPHYAHMMSPLKVFEYMASGTPIITTDLPSLREVLSDSDAYFVPPGDTGSFAAGIKKLLANTDTATTLGQNARERAKQYSWSTRAKNILEHIAV